MPVKVIEKKELYSLLQSLFSKAQKDIRIVSAWINGNVIRELLSSLKKGVHLEAIIRAEKLSDMNITDAIFFKELKRKEGRIYFNKRLHSKFLIIDDRYVIVGSSNITYTGVHDNTEGNIETNVLIDEEEEVKKFKELYEKIKNESEECTNIVGFVINSINSKECFVTFLEDLDESMYLLIEEDKDSFFLARIVYISAYKEVETDTLKKIFINDNRDWKKVSMYAYLNELPEMRLGKLEVLGKYSKGEKAFRPAITPISPGSIVKRLEGENNEAEEILKKTRTGYSMEKPVYVGKLYGTSLRVFIDMAKIIPMHMAVIGTTGSGKTTFVKKVLKNIPEGIEVFVFDIYGEYGYELKSVKNVKEIMVEDTLFPLSTEDMKRILTDAGAGIDERTVEGKEFFTFLRKHLLPDLTKTKLNRKNLEEILEQAAKSLPLSWKREIEDAIDYIRETFGKYILLNQPSVLEKIIEGFRSDEEIKIFNFRKVDTLETKLNLIGLILKEIFLTAKAKPGNRLVVIEESHNVAPEKNLSGIPYGKENLASINCRKIAMEGRKFNLGMIAVTQRPASINKFVLSQMNTQVIFKLITRNDLEAVSVFFEYSKEDIFKTLPFLSVGTAFIGGIGVPFSLTFQIEEISFP